MPEELKNLPYLEWLEESLQNLIKMPVKSICMCVKLDDDAIITSYYEATMMDKICFSVVISQEAMLQTLAANSEDEENAEE